MDNLQMINMADVAVQEVDWLLYPFIPYGKITIIQGDPGEGKTTLVLRLIAAMTTGKPLIGNTDAESTEPVNVIYQNCEESHRLAALRDTLLPKLMKGEIEV